MKIKEERDKLESLLDSASDRITENVPTPGNIPEELQGTPTMGIDFADLKEICVDEARIMINNAIGFILTDDVIENNPYVKNKLEVDVLSLSGMLYQLKVNEAMQRALMEEVDKGFMNPRMFEVFGQLSKTIGDLNKQLLGTVEAIKITYKDIKIDIQEAKDAALGPGSQPAGMITQGDGSQTTMGSKELINQIKERNKLKFLKDNPDVIQDAEEVAG